MVVVAVPEPGWKNNILVMSDPWLNQKNILVIIDIQFNYILHKTNTWFIDWFPPIMGKAWGEVLK